MQSKAKNELTDDDRDILRRLAFNKEYQAKWWELTSSDLRDEAEYADAFLSCFDEQPASADNPIEPQPPFESEYRTLTDKIKGFTKKGFLYAPNLVDTVPVNSPKTAKPDHPIISKEGTVFEGTCAWNGCLPDLEITAKARKMVKDMVKVVEKIEGESTDLHELITQRQMAVRMLLPNNHVDDMVVACSLSSVEAAKTNDQSVGLEKFFAARTGDCRINNIALAIACEDLIVQGYIEYIEYANRHWGHKAFDKEEEVGRQGDHALLQFKVPGEEIYTLDAFARQHDRQLIPSGQTRPSDGWTTYDAKYTSGPNNAWRRLIENEWFASMDNHMTPSSKMRFIEQANFGPTTEAVYLGDRMAYPKFFVPEKV